MTVDLEADVVVIGAGPSGAAATWRLARSGLSVICLERGHWFDFAELGHGQPGYQHRRAGRFHENPNIRRGADDTLVDDGDSPIKVSIGNAVGGGSIWWAAHIPRYRPDDFRVRSLDGVAADWPIAYADLAPYYDINEAMMGLATVPGDPAGPPRQGNHHPLPDIGPAGRRMAEGFARLGWHCWPVDLAIGHGSAACTHPGPCEPGCPARQSAGADRCYMQPALDSGARLITGARVINLEHDRTGQVTAAVVVTESGTIRVRGARFVLAANGIGTPRLLLLSASASQPNGLGNRSGQLGRNLMLHPHARVDGRFDSPLGHDIPGRKAGLVCLEFRASRPEHDFPRGFKMQFSPAAQHDGPDFDRIAGLTICIEDLPEAHNRITLADTQTDRDGAPIAKLTYRLSQASRRALDFAMNRAEAALRAAGATDFTRDPLKAQAGFHLMGTARMGTSPEDSVVDPHGRCHDAPNVYLADASIFVTGSAMNPTSTAQALALRIADHIIAAR